MPDGTKRDHLSVSSYTTWHQCREKWRRRYILGISDPEGPAAFLGKRVDDALTQMYRMRMTGEHLSGGQVADVFRDIWRAKVAEADVAWSDEEPRDKSFSLGLEAVAFYLEHMAPQLGDAVATQRRIAMRLTPQADWTILGYIDLETLIAAGDEHGGAQVSAAVDYKVKGKVILQSEADADMQAGLYLTHRALEGNPADWFFFASLKKPDKRSKAGKLTGKLVSTKCSAQRIRGVLVRMAQFAREVNAAYRRFGPEQSWEFATPGEAFPCSPKWCAHWNQCPGGGAA
jgi:hypothetical protein